jgi:hypothetical protein
MVLRGVFLGVKGTRLEKEPVTNCIAYDHQHGISVSLSCHRPCPAAACGPTYQVTSLLAESGMPLRRAVSGAGHLVVSTPGE